jgi:toxin ParE1/3/4
VAARVSWTESAWQEVEQAASYIAQDSPRYAAALVDEIRSAARSLRRFPNRGRIVPEVGDETVRELFVKNYRLIYEIRGEDVVILALVHGARRLSGL